MKSGKSDYNLQLRDLLSLWRNAKTKQFYL